MGAIKRMVVKPHDWRNGICQACGVKSSLAFPACKPPHLGSAVVNPGTPSASLRYSSVSQLKTATACLRKWHFEKVLGKRPPEKQWLTTGTDLHEELKRYLLTGVNQLSPLAMTGLHLLPTPGDDLFVEHTISGVPQLADPKLYLAGVPFVGSVDLMHNRGINKGGSEIEETNDPDGTVEICDHKSAKSLQYALTPQDLAADIQMNGYGVYAALTIPGVQHVRLSHHYFTTGKRTPAVKRTIRLPVARVHETWESYAPTMRLMQQAATTAESDDVAANTKSCSAYGGCPHLSYCSMGNPLHRFLTEENTVGLLDDIMKPKPSELDAQIAELAAKERAAHKQPEVPQPFIDACKVIEASGMGFPPVKGEVSRYVQIMKGITPVQDRALAGSGQLGAVEYQSDPDVIVKLAADLCERMPELRAKVAAIPTPVAQAVRPVQQVLPPDAPKSDPFKLSAPVNPAAQVIAAATPAPVPAPDPTVEKKRGRPPGVKNRHTESASEKEATSTGVTLYIDCIEHPPAESLHPFINQMCDEIMERYRETMPFGQVPVDIRLCQGEILGFGKWKGVLAAVFKEAVEAHRLIGAYHVNTLGCEIAQCVVNALRGNVDAFIRGA